jgi:hypothetical protein
VKLIEDSDHFLVSLEEINPERKDFVLKIQDQGFHEPMCFKANIKENTAIMINFEPLVPQSQKDL